MESIQGLIFSFINKKKRNPKSLLKIKEAVFNIVNEHNVLFKAMDDKGNYIPYMQIKNGDIIEFGYNVQEIQILFNMVFGIDLFQNKLAKELFNYIKGKILFVSKEIVFSKFIHRTADQLYISCGNNHLVTFNESGSLIKVINGYDDVYFDKNYSLPEWTPTNSNTITIFSNMDAFNIKVAVPDGPYIYTEEMQKYVLKTWIIGTLLKIKPMPILLFFGNKSSGKTLTSKAIMKLLMGDSSNVSIFPDNKRGLMTCITENFVYTMDNLDSKTPTWFADTLTIASTGGQLSERLLFSDYSSYSKSILASIIITSRNANFAKREDIKDRLIPIFFEDRSDYTLSEEVLLKFIILNRDSILSELCHDAKSFIDTHDSIKFTEQYRFTTFGQLLTHLIPSNSNFNISQLIKSIVASQFNSLSDMDPLIQYILEFDFNKLATKVIEGTPVEIISILESNTSYVNTLKPRVFSRKIKENLDVFKMNGWDVTFYKFGHTTKFRFIPNNTIVSEPN